MTVIQSLVNGKPEVYISIKDRGLNYGDGLFETIAIIKHNPIFWAQHYQRLVNGGKILGIDIPTENYLKNGIKNLCQTEDIAGNYVVKLIITRGESERGYRVPFRSNPNVILTLLSYPVYNSEYWLKGVNVKLCRTQLSQQAQLAGLKHLNRLEQVLARREWDDEYQEGLMSDTAGNIIEGTMSNIFIVKDGGLITPSLSQAGVRGIMRDVILNICEIEAIPIKEEVVSLALLNKAEEVFLTNSLIGIWPVKNIEDSLYPVGDVTKNIMQLLVNTYSVDYGSLSL